MLLALFTSFDYLHHSVLHGPAKRWNAEWIPDRTLPWPCSGSAVPVTPNQTEKPRIRKDGRLLMQAVRRFLLLLFVIVALCVDFPDFSGPCMGPKCSQQRPLHSAWNGLDCCTGACHFCPPDTDWQNHPEFAQFGHPIVGPEVRGMYQTRTTVPSGRRQVKKPNLLQLA